MTGQSALVVGPTGAIGAALVSAIARQVDWNVYGMSRSAPSHSVEFAHLAADLLDEQSVARALSAAEPITHLFYAARAPHLEGGIEDVESNVRMLMNVVNAVDAHSPKLAHVHLVEGTKWYGVHLGAHRTPAREDDPRHLPPNFYYDQEDSLGALQQTKRWTWSASRPNVVCDFAPARARNLTSIIGAYAAICRELSVPLDFPGTRRGYESLTEVTDGNHLAEGIVWMATQPGGRNRPFNITNGDAFRWRYMWPRIAEMLDVPCGEPRDIRLSSWMADKGPVWDRVVARNQLAPRSLESVALWSFGDFVFRQDWDLLSDLTRLRQIGFAGSIDSVEMFERQFEQYQNARILPGRHGAI